jgi:membrane protease YdiL (CAAX protease family)
MNVRQLFFDDNGRLRSGFRLAIFCTIFFFAVAVASGIVNLILPPTTPPYVYRLGGALLALSVALFVGWLCGKLLEGLPFRALGAWFTEGWLRNFLFGSLAGAATLCLAVLIAVVFGGLSFELRAVDVSALITGLASSFVLLGAAAASEEALFRGYPFQTFVRSGLAWLAIALTSAFFGIVHSGNPDSGIIPIVNTILAGIWFGIAYLKTRDLWFVWGLHLMWNWMQGAFFGIEISGLTDLASTPLLKEIDAGPRWLTGETYGVEGGIVTTIALVLSTGVIYYVPWLKAGRELWSDADRSQNRER